jgi:hypothetical protein
MASIIRGFSVTSRLSLALAADWLYYTNALACINFGYYDFSAGIKLLLAI